MLTQLCCRNEFSITTWDNNSAFSRCIALRPCLACLLLRGVRDFMLVHRYARGPRTSFATNIRLDIVGTMSDFSNLQSTETRKHDEIQKLGGQG